MFFSDLLLTRFELGRAGRTQACEILFSTGKPVHISDWVLFTRFLSRDKAIYVVYQQKHDEIRTSRCTAGEGGEQEKRRRCASARGGGSRGAGHFYSSGMFVFVASCCPALQIPITPFSHAPFHSDALCWPSAFVGIGRSRLRHIRQSLLHSLIQSPLAI